MTRCPRFVRLRLVELSENSSMISRARPRSHARKGVPILIIPPSGVVQATGLQRLVFKIPELCDGHWSVAGNDVASSTTLLRAARRPGVEVSTWHRSSREPALRYNS